MQTWMGVVSLLAIVAGTYGQGVSPPGTYPMAGCKPGWTNFGKFCYRYFNEKFTWLNAQKECQNHSALPGATPRGWLMTAKDMQHNRFQHNWLRYTGGGLNKVWLGLAERTNDNYFWADGLPLLPSHWNRWKVDQPQLNAHIQAVHTFDSMADKSWVTSFHETEISFVCQYQYKPY